MRRPRVWLVGALLPWVLAAPLLAQGPTPPRRLLIIPARFTDSPAPPVGRQTMQNQFFDGPGDSGTLPQFFLEASGGRFQLTGDVHDWVDTPIHTSQWLLPGIEFGSMRVDYAAAAIRSADPDTDYGLYDNDGPDGAPNSGDDDGIVDAGVTILWAEVQSTCVGSALHPSAIGLSAAAPIPTDDRTPSGQPIVVRRLGFASSVDCSGSQVAGIAVIAHELGHQMLGLPDRYSSQGIDRLTQRRWVLGCWNIMAAGSGWGCGSGEEARWRTPTLFGPGERTVLGWLTPTVVPPVRDQVFVLRPSAGDGNVLRIPVNPGSATEFFHIEYRQRIGFDSNIPASGVLIYSVDESITAAASCGGTCRAYREHVIEADGRADLLFTGEEGGNRGEASDAFGPLVRKLAGNTSPSSRRRNGGFSTLTVHDVEIDEAAQVARVRLSTAATPAFLRVEGQALTATGLDSVHLIVRAAGGSLPYSWTGTGFPAGVAVSVFPGTDSISLRGILAASGQFQPRLTLTDPLGNSLQTAFDWAIGAPQLPVSTIFRAVVLGALEPTLGSPEVAYLDQMGNRNGRLDVGDARAQWLRAP